MKLQKRTNENFNIQYSLFNIQYSFFLFSFLFTLAGHDLRSQSIPYDGPDQKWALVIHGGAGGSVKEKITKEMQEQYSNVLNEALKAAAGILKTGGSSLDAVEKAIRIMEDSPLFNAGKGSVFTAEGKNEMDASIMDGKTGKAGAVAGVSTIRNPISAARAVMEKSKHVMLTGEGAENFAKKQGLEIVDPSYFYTKRRWDELQKSKEEAADTAKEHGTVGAVALDLDGNIAAGTSTGGMTNKMKGRIGDSPIIGAGTYANNETCGVSCTGHGEFFIRNVVAYDVSAIMSYLGISVNQAANYIVNNKLANQGAEGGLIAIDHDGNITMQYNTVLMFRGYVSAEGKTGTFIY